MRRVRHLLAVLLVAAVTGCANTSVDRNTELHGNDGIIIVRITSNEASFTQMIHPVEYGRGTGNLLGTPIIEVITPGLTIFMANSVNLYFSNLFTPNGKILWPPAKDSVQLKATPQKIVYAGDVFIKVSNVFGNYLVNYEIVDNEAQTVAEARKQNPELFEKYGYVKALAVDPAPQ